VKQSEITPTIASVPLTIQSWAAWFLLSG